MLCEKRHDAVVVMDNKCLITLNITVITHKLASAIRYIYNYLGRLLETFEGKNFHKFCSFLDVCKSFLRKIWGHNTFDAVKVTYFSPTRESFLP